MPAGDAVLDNGSLLAHPDDESVARDHPILREEGGERCTGRRVRLDHPLPVVGMENVEPELILVQPGGALVAQQILDLRADVDGQRRSRVVRLDEIQVDHEARDVLDQILEAALELRARDGCSSVVHGCRMWLSAHVSDGLS